MTGFAVRNSTSGPGTAKARGFTANGIREVTVLFVENQVDRTARTARKGNPIDSVLKLEGNPWTYGKQPFKPLGTLMVNPASDS